MLYILFKDLNSNITNKRRRQSPSKKFLSKLNKFERLSRGITDQHLISTTQQQKVSSEAAVKSNSSIESSGTSSGSSGTGDVCCLISSSSSSSTSSSASSSPSSTSSVSTVKSSASSSQLCSLTTTNKNIRQTISLFDEMLKHSTAIANNLEKLVLFSLFQ